VQGSGGGGPVEAVWWVEEVGTQWRVKGRAFVVADDVEDDEGDSEGRSGVRTLKSEVGKRMRLVDESKEKEWSWEREVERCFGNCSPGIRGTFIHNPYLVYLWLTAPATCLANYIIFKAFSVRLLPVHQSIRPAQTKNCNWEPRSKTSEIRLPARISESSSLSRIPLSRPI
jgi:hypothetical protein